jgi:hypothetical protein
MSLRIVVLAAAWFSFAPTAWAQDLCALVQDTSLHLTVDASNEDYQAFGDAYTGGAEEAWRGVSGATR